MIHLKHLEPFAAGGKRLCYVHPDDPARCIKVYKQGRRPVDQKAADPWWKQLRPTSCYDENLRDYTLFLEAHVKAPQTASTHIPRLPELVETDLGQGLALELIRDEDGSISISAKEYIQNHGASAACNDAIDQLECFLLKHHIHFRDPFPHNLAFRRRSDESVEAVIIDGLGNSSILPIYKWISSIGEEQIRKKIARLRKGVRKTADPKLQGLAKNPTNGQRIAP